MDACWSRSPPPPNTFIFNSPYLSFYSLYLIRVQQIQCCPFAIHQSGSTARVCEPNLNFDKMGSWPVPLPVTDSQIPMMYSSSGCRESLLLQVPEIVAIADLFYPGTFKSLSQSSVDSFGPLSSFWRGKLVVSTCLSTKNIHFA